MGPMGHIHPNTRPYFQKVDNPSIWYGPVVRNFWPKNSTKKIVIFGVTVTIKLHFFHENGLVFGCTMSHGALIGNLTGSCP